MNKPVKKFTMNNSQVFRLFRWVEENKARIAELSNSTEVCDLFNKEMANDAVFAGNQVGQHQMMSALKENGVQLRSFRGPKSEEDAKFKIIAAQLVKVCKALDIPIDPAVTALANK